MRIFSIFLFIFSVSSLVFSQNVKNNEQEVKTQKDDTEKKEFKSSIKYGVGVIGQTTVQQTADGSGYNFQPFSLKKGFLHSNFDITEKLSGKFMMKYHGKDVAVLDLFIEYFFNEHFGIRAGRSKGSGPKTHMTMAVYDHDFTEIPFSVTEYARDLRIGDFRRNGLTFLGKYDWLKYSLTLHDGDGTFNYFHSQQFVNVQNPKHNVGFKLTNFDLHLNLKPIKDVELGGHFGRVSLPGMGRESTNNASGYLYYTPGKWRFKADYLTYDKTIFEDGQMPNFNDYSLHPYKTVNRQGYSFLVAYHITPKLEAAARYEHFDFGKLKEVPKLKYEDLDIYTVGLTFYPMKNKRNKLSVYYEHFDEKNTIPGFNKPNDVFSIAYQIHFMKPIK